MRDIVLVVSTKRSFYHGTMLADNFCKNVNIGLLCSNTNKTELLYYRESVHFTVCWKVFIYVYNVQQYFITLTLFKAADIWLKSATIRK